MSDNKKNLAGLYVLEKNENLEDFMRENGAPFPVRKMASMSTPELEITQDGDDITIKLSSLFKSKVESFTVGKDFEQEQHDGRMYTVKTEWVDDKLVISYVPKTDDGTPSKVERELTETGLLTTMYVKDVVAKRYFKRKSTAV